MLNNFPYARKQRITGLIGGGLLMGVLITLGIQALLRPAVLTSRQASIHPHSAAVMPFDVALTTHIFEMTELGGIQQVVVKNERDAKEIALIQQHLQHEAARFQAGDFRDPVGLHGATMPGVQDLSASAGQLHITYVPLANGGQITYTAPSPQLVTAIHRWFGAQLADHGTDAQAR